MFIRESFPQVDLDGSADRIEREVIGFVPNGSSISSPSASSPNLPQLFLNARDSLMSHFRPILNQFGVTEQQWRILRLLDEHGQLEPRELCDLCQIFSSSMAGVLVRMEETGLVRRNRVAGDQRRVMVRLAPKGSRLMQAMAPLIELQYQHIEQKFGKRATADLIQTLEGFIAATGDPARPVGSEHHP